MATTIDPLLSFAPRTSGVSSRAGSAARGAVRPRPSQRTFQRRRRTVAAVMVFGLASGFITTNAFASNPSTDQQVIPRTVVAKSGDTIWDIARTIVPEGGIADLVAELVRMNGSRIEPGQVIRIP